jgi:hypothetical protein
MEERAKKLGLSVPDLIRLLVLCEQVEAQVEFLLEQVNERRDCAQLMAALARSGISQSLKSIAQNLRNATYVDSPDARKQMSEAHEFVQWMRNVLMKRQGLRKP